MERPSEARHTIKCRYLGKNEGRDDVTYRFDVGDLVLKERKYGFFEKLWEAKANKARKFKLILQFDLSKGERNGKKERSDGEESQGQ